MTEITSPNIQLRYFEVLAWREIKKKSLDKNVIQPCIWIYKGNARRPKNMKSKQARDREPF